MACGRKRLVINCLVNKYSVGHIQFLLEDNATDKAIDLLYDMIHDETISVKVKNLAKINLAELLLQGNDVDEDNSPLLTSDPFLTNDNCLMKRAIQAYYLLHDIDNDDSKKLSARFENILAGNTKAIIIPTSKENWLSKAKEYYMHIQITKRSNLM